MNLLTAWKVWRRKRRAIREAAECERRRAAIRAQIARRREARQAWKPKLGELQQATTAALNAERWL